MFYKRTNIFNRVQAENENFSPPTFLKRFDLSFDLAAIFLTSGTVFTCHIGLLPSPPWPPLALPPFWTGLPRASEMNVRNGIFG